MLNDCQERQREALPFPEGQREALPFPKSGAKRCPPRPSREALRAGPNSLEQHQQQHAAIMNETTKTERQNTKANRVRLCVSTLQVGGVPGVVET